MQEFNVQTFVRYIVVCVAAAGCVLFQSCRYRKCPLTSCLPLALFVYGFHRKRYPVASAVYLYNLHHYVLM